MKNTKRKFFAAVGTCLAVGISLGTIPRHGAAQAQQEKPAADTGIHVLPVQANIYMLVGDGANITVQTGPDGVLLVDAGTGQMTDKLLATVRTISDAPIRYLVN